MQSFCLKLTKLKLCDFFKLKKIESIYVTTITIKQLVYKVLKDFDWNSATLFHGNNSNK